MPVSITRRRVDKKTAGNTGWYSQKQRMEAVTKYLVIGNLNEVARQTGISEETLRRWKASSWWKEFVEDVKQQEATELSGTLGKLIGKALSSTEERLQNGDYFFNKVTNKIERIPAKLKDINQVAKDLMVQRTSLNAAINVQKISESTIEERLKSLHEEFKKFASGKIIIKEVLDVEPIEGSVSEPEGKS